MADSGKRPPAPPVTGDPEIDEFLREVREQVNKVAAAEQARFAALSPQQQAAKIAGRQRERALAKARPYLQMLRERDTWTIEQFAWLLLHERPEGPSPYTISPQRFAKSEQHARITAILESCVGTRLQPVNPQDPTEQRRFATGSLFEVAKADKLGWAALAEDSNGDNTARPVTAAGAPKHTAPTTRSRERNKPRRRKALIALARELIAAGKGVERSDCLELSMRGVELNALLRTEHPEWRGISDDTLERDRRECRPRIDVLPGRPPGSRTI